MNIAVLEAADFSVDQQQRTMRALIVPWGRVGKHSNGRRWRFSRGGLKYAGAKYLRLNSEHVQSAKLGRAVSVEETAEGLVATFAIYPGKDGDRALALAAEGTKTGFSVEIEFDESDSVADPDDPGVLLVNEAHLTGVAFVQRPAFDNARLISVRASEEGTGMPEETPKTEETPAAPQAPVTLSDDQFKLLAAAFAQHNPTMGIKEIDDAQRREVVTPTIAGKTTTTTEVNEPVSYRFSRSGQTAEGARYVFSGETEHDLSRDLLSIAKAAAEHRAPGAALARVEDFIKRTFADVEIADVPGTRVPRLHPEMWVPQLDYATPLWDMVGRGPVDEMPFYVPKFTSASGLVASATEKTEPAGGSFVDELQTITPGQLWGKVEISRQLWRSQGTPQLSGILWDQMLRSFYEAREAAIATFLGTLTAATDIALTATGATPTNTERLVTVGDLEAALGDLNFARGGQRFTGFAVHQSLYRVLSRVTDTTGRPLYPQISPMNANGTTARRYRTIEIGGTTAVPAYALGTPSNASSNSWLFDPNVVMSWASAPERLFWDFGATVQATTNIPQLSFVTLGLYANYANANTDISGVRQVTFDPNSAA